MPKANSSMKIGFLIFLTLLRAENIDIATCFLKEGGR